MIATFSSGPIRYLLLEPAGASPGALESHGTAPPAESTRDVASATWRAYTSSKVHFAPSRGSRATKSPRLGCPEAGDRTRTGTESLEGSCASVTPRPRNATSLGPRLCVAITDEVGRRSRPDWNAAEARWRGAGRGIMLCTSRDPATRPAGLRCPPNRGDWI